MSPRTRTDTTTLPEGGTPSEWTITIPQAADWMSLNDRHHWAKRAKATRAWRNAALVVARAARLPKGLERAHLDVTFHKATRRSYDVHNLMPTAKAIVDGLVGTPRHPGYGLLPDDDNAHLTGPDLHAGEVAVRPCVVVTIRAGRVA